MLNVLSEANYLLSTIYAKLLSKLLLDIRVQTPVETANDILKNNKSLVRFGDGELEWLDENHVANFQVGNKDLANDLRTVIQRKEDKLLIGIPNAIVQQSNLSLSERKWWRKWLARNVMNIRLYVNHGSFASTNFSRPYIMYKYHEYSDDVFRIIKKIFNKKEIIIIEGDQTRFGVGNDILNGAQNVQRIICPSRNAYSKKKEILNFVRTSISNSSDTLVLLSLGPTATVLGSILFDDGFQVIDIGHADLEYEWFCRQDTVKTNLKYKGVNEVDGGYVVEDLPNQIKEKYESEIIKVI